MAYADTNTRPDTTSLLVSLGVNTALITAIIFAAPNLEDSVSPVITEIFTPVADPPPDKPVEIKETTEAKPEPRPFVAPKPIDTKTPPGTEFIMPRGPDIVLPPGPTIDPKPFISTPPPPAPTIISAKPHPGYANQLQPTYPPGMIRDEREGVVTVRVLIGTDGRVRQVSIVSAESPEFAEATERQALKKWRFLPATRDGMPFESWREMTVRFKLPRY